MHTRRKVLTTAAAALATTAPWPMRARAGDGPIQLDWDDLVPGGSGETMERLRQQGIIQHGEMNTGFDQDTSANLTTEFNGKLVRIPGYLVPLEYDGAKVKTALLVPFVGACIHVPPPPPNQLIFIIAEADYENPSLFEPVWIEGVFGTSATSTQLAEVGYTMVAKQIDPYS